MRARPAFQSASFWAKDFFLGPEVGGCEEGFGRAIPIASGLPKRVSGERECGFARIRRVMGHWSRCRCRCRCPGPGADRPSRRTTPASTPSRGASASGRRSVSPSSSTRLSHRSLPVCPPAPPPIDDVDALLTSPADRKLWSAPGGRTRVGILHPPGSCPPPEVVGGGDWEVFGRSDRSGHPQSCQAVRVRNQTSLTFVGLKNAVGGWERGVEVPLQRRWVCSRFPDVTPSLCNSPTFRKPRRGSRSRAAACIFSAWTFPQTRTFPLFSTPPYMTPLRSP